MPYLLLAGGDLILPDLAQRHRDQDPVALAVEAPDCAGLRMRVGVRDGKGIQFLQDLELARERKVDGEQLLKVLIPYLDRLV